MNRRLTGYASPSAATGWFGLLSAASAVIVCGSLAACAGGKSPEPEPSVSTASPSYTPPQPPDVPVLPDQVHTDAGAADMFEYVLEAYVYAFTTNDASYFKEVSQEDCGFCSRVIEGVANNASQSLHVENMDIQIRAIDADFISDRFHKGEAIIDEASRTVRDAEGKVVSAGPKVRTKMTFGLNWVRGVWKVRVIETEPGEDAS